MYIEEEEQGLEITPMLLQKLAMSKIFKDHQKEINSIDFSRDGSMLVSCDDTTLNVYDVLSAKKIRTLYNKTHEIDLVKFTIHNSAVICVTKKEPYEIYYWSLHENEIIKKFKGHVDAIYWIDMCYPIDLFLTCSRDMTLRIWNLNSLSSTCEAILDLRSQKAHPVGAFDTAGIVFAVAYHEDYYGIEQCKISMYDINKYQQVGSFVTWKKDCPRIAQLKFSNSGKDLLCATKENCIIILDAFNGQKKLEITDYNNENSFIEASFTPDSKYIISGSESGHIHIWDAETGVLVKKYEGHQTKCKVVKFCPTHALMASGCRNLVFWTIINPEQLVLRQQAQYETQNHTKLSSYSV